MIVLDTHAWIWLVDSPEKLGVRTRRAIETSRESADVYVSCISTWEIYMLVAKGRLELGVLPETWVHRCEELSFLHFVPVDNEIARLSVTACGTMHGDPADRMIAATALYLGAPLATCDRKLQDCDVVPCVW
jgi:PIN domain nuclease of toxin-antitoxin system